MTALRGVSGKDWGIVSVVREANGSVRTMRGLKAYRQYHFRSVAERLTPQLEAQEHAIHREKDEAQPPRELEQAVKLITIRDIASGSDGVVNDRRG